MNLSVFSKLIGKRVVAVEPVPQQDYSNKTQRDSGFVFCLDDGTRLEIIHVDIFEFEGGPELQDSFWRIGQSRVENC